MKILVRLLEMLITVWLSASIAFWMLRVLPGDAIRSQLLQSGASQKIVEERRTQQGLDDPLGVQYIRFITNTMRGNLGYSLSNGLPVAELIAEYAQPTFALASGALLVATMLGVTLGVAGALQLGWGGSTIAQIIISLAISTPIYWTGTVTIFVSATLLNELSSANVLTASQVFLPAVVLGFHTSAAIGRVVETQVREALISDFVRTARAKGLPESLIIRRHVLRVGLLPVVTVIAIQAGFLLSGTVITESLFTRPGIGKLLLESTLEQDYPVVQGIVVLASGIYTFLNAGADMLYAALDPRVKW